MPSDESTRRRSVRGVDIALVTGCLVLALHGCAVAESGGRPPVAQGAGNASCSLRAVVNVRQGASIRSDSDLVEAGRRLGINIIVLQPMGRNARMIVFQENGPQEACEDSLAILRSDLHIESIERF